MRMLGTEPGSSASVASDLNSWASLPLCLWFLESYLFFLKHIMRYCGVWMRNVSLQIQGFGNLLPRWWQCLWRFKRCDLATGSKGFWALPYIQFPQFASCFLLLMSCLLLGLHAMVDSYHSGIISLNKLFLLWAPLTVGFYHTIRKATNTDRMKTLNFKKKVYKFCLRNTL